MTRLQPVILAIDDDAKVLRLVEDSLATLYQVRSFAVPEEALSALRLGLKPDLIVCDISMPELSGFDVHRAVRETLGLRSVPFVYLTALDDREHIRRGMNLGADDYLTKPFRPSELRDVVRLRLSRAALLKDEASRTPLEVRSLGGFAVFWQAQPLRWEAKRAAEVFLHLLSAQLRDGKDAVLVETLKAELWREPIEDNTLYVTLGRVRKMLPSVTKVVLRKGYSRLELGADIVWDALDYERAATRALRAPHDAVIEIEEAIKRYHGEFLPGFDSPWSESERRRYEARFGELLQAAIDTAPNATARRIAEVRFAKFMS